MIGFLLLLVFGLWIVISITLDIKIPKWLGITRYRTGLGAVLVTLIFVAPVADEIIVYPQLRAMCKRVGNVEYDPQTAAGQTVSKYPPIVSKKSETLFPNIQVLVQQGAYVAPITEIPVVKWGWIEPHAGFFKFPAGSSGNSMPLLLTDCGFTPRNGELRKIIDPLKLVKVEYQPTKYK